MNTTALRSSLSLLIAAAAIVAALPTPAMALKVCPLRNCGGTDGEDPNGTSRHGLELYRDPAKANGFAIRGAVLPEPVVSLKMCPLRGCGSGTDGEEPNGSSSTGLEVQRSTARASNFAIQRVVLPEPVVSIRVCPYRNCGGAEDEPNGMSRTGSDLLDVIRDADSFEIGRVVLSHSVR